MASISVLMAGAALGGAHLHSGAAGVQISYESTSSITLHEPVILNFSVHNQSAETIRFDLGANCEQNFSFRIVRPNGSLQKTRWIYEGGLAMIGQMELEPAKSYSKKLLVSELYYFDDPGGYRIEAGMTSPIKGATGEAILANISGSVTINVLPRDPGVLNRECERLTTVVEQMAPVGEDGDAARTLSCIIDPVSVPYLERVLATGRWDGFALRGLARVANGPALKALKSAAGSEIEYRRALAKRMLERIQQGERDPLLRTRPKIID